MLPNPSTSVKSYDGQTKWIYFLIKDDDLLVLKKDDRYYQQVFLKKSKYIEKKVIGHNHDNLSDFSGSSDESNKEQIKATREQF